MGRLLPKCHHQPGQFQQVFQAERRATGRDGCDGIGRNPIRPAGRDRDKPPLRVTIVEEFIAPILPDRYYGELLAVARMEGMDDAEDSIAIVRTGCNRRRRRMLFRKDSCGAPNTSA